MKHKAKTRFQIPISPNSLPPAGSLETAFSGQQSAISLKQKAKTRSKSTSPQIPCLRRVPWKQLSAALSDQLEAKGENQTPNPHLPKFPASGGFLGNSFQRSAVSDQLEAKGENQTPNPHLPKFPAFGERSSLESSYQPSAFSLKQKAKTRFQIPISPNSLPPARSGSIGKSSSALSAVSASGEFSLKHKAKTRFQIHYLTKFPASGGFLGNSFQRSALSDQLEAKGENQIPNPHLPKFPASGEERFILQKSGKAAISYQPSAFSLKHKAKTRFQIPISPNSLPPAGSLETAFSGQQSAISLKHKETRFQIPISPNSLPPAGSLETAFSGQQSAHQPSA